MGKKNTDEFPKTAGSKKARYIKRFRVSVKSNDPVKCRLARKIAKEEAMLERKRRSDLSAMEQERENATRAAAEKERNLRAKEQSKRFKKLMIARHKKERSERRRYLRSLKRAKATQANSNSNSLWAKNGANYVKWYHQSFELASKPVHFMTVPNMLQPLDCGCRKQAQKVDLYMNHWHEQVVIEHCPCRGLVESLLLMQMMPSSACTPRTGIHFGLLDYLHLLKMGSQVSNHAFADITNKSIAMSQLEAREFRPLSKSILNRSYFLYRRLVTHSDDVLNNTYGLKHTDCYCCDHAKERIAVSLDGNFQLKRRSNHHPTNFSANNYSSPAASTVSPPANLFHPSSLQNSLWGTKQEVEKFEKQDKADSNDNCMIQELEREFKAVSERNRTMYNRYDENGVFSMTCSRHGIPLRLYDIYRGEGRKYALASIEHVLNTRQYKQPLSIMYDIACLCQSRLEAAFPLLKSEDTLYAIPIFHAYAHNIHCQLQYNPRYIVGFGLTDGEGTERLWSYLNGFASMTRSMTSDNRHLVLTDAVVWYKNARMREIPQIINKKFQTCSRQLLLLEMDDQLFVGLEGKWKEKVKALSLPGKKVDGVVDAVVRDLSEQDQIFLYLELISQYLALGFW
ncbi:unnamed protein product [Mucor circinelloides]